MKKHEIVITMEGGLIQDIQYIPKNIQIRVLDFDEDQSDDPRVEIINGDKAYVTIWEAES